MNCLPKTVARQRRDCDLNPGPSTPDSSSLSTRLPSHRVNCEDGENSVRVYLPAPGIDVSS